MRVWRLARGRYAPPLMARAPAAGGRWNPPGVAVAYTSAALSRAVLELLAHVDPEDVPEGLVAFEVDVPDDLLVETMSGEELPAVREAAAALAACRAIGHRWVEGTSSPVLRVPSAVVPQEANHLLNPAHVEAGRVRVVGRPPFRFDPRLPGFRGG